MSCDVGKAPDSGRNCCGAEVDRSSRLVPRNKQRVRVAELSHTDARVGGQYESPIHTSNFVE